MANQTGPDSLTLQSERPTRRRYRPEVRPTCFPTGVCAGGHRYEEKPAEIGDGKASRTRVRNSVAKHYLRLGVSAEHTQASAKEQRNIFDEIDASGDRQYRRRSSGLWRFCGPLNVCIATLRTCRSRPCS